MLRQNTKICHWNIRGFRSNYHHLKTLLVDTQAVVMCLQETKLPQNHRLDYPRGFTMFSKSGPHADNTVDHGGVCTLVKNNVAHHPIQLQTELQAVAVRCHLDQLYTICNIYLPPNTAISLEDLEDLLEQLPAPYMIIGDFNARHPIWGDTSTNPKGRLIESMIANNNCSILNDGRPTHFHIQTSSFTCIDLSIASSDIATHFTWNVNQDLYNSDHYPVLLSIDDSTCKETPIRFIFEKADWSKFKRSANVERDPCSFDSVDDATEYVTDIIIGAAKRSIPQTKGTIRTKPVPWWNPEVSEAIRERKVAIRRYYRTGLLADKIKFKRARARARYLIETARRKSWNEYVSSLTESTPINEVWNRVKKIKGRYNGQTQPVLQGPDGIVTDPALVANMFGESISNISLGWQTPQHNQAKQRLERSRVIFPNDGGEDYNCAFTSLEYENALKLSSNSAAGEDKIYYSMIEHLPAKTTKFLLDLFNIIYLENKFPKSWRIAIMLPFSKQGKDKLQVTNYRPISLTSCMCKLLERMVNTRLVWNLEKRNCIHDNQYGFRRNRSTTDALIRLDSFIKVAFARKEHVVAVFFDLEKAYDTTWRQVIIMKLQNAGLVGHLPIFIQNFLSERILKVRIGNTISAAFTQHEGVPQGSVLSCSLFALAINDILKSIPQYVESSLYVDDLVIFARSNSLNAAERRVQLAVNQAYKWSTAHGFKFSPQKTVSMHFTKLRGLFPPLTITMNNNAVPAVNEAKFLGLIFDTKLSWIPHLKNLRNKCLKTMDLIKCLSHATWGADRMTLLRIYRALIRSQLDYGCQAYASAPPSTLKMLDPIHHMGLRLSTGTLRSSPVISLYAESGEPSLSYRREKLSLQLYCRLSSMQGTPTQRIIMETQYDHYFSNNSRLHSTFGYRIRKQLQLLLAPDPMIMPSISYNIAPYSLLLEHPCSGVTDIRRADLPNEIIRKVYKDHLRTEHSRDLKIYTDGSKSDNGVGFAVVTPNNTLSRRIPDAASVFTAEIQAIRTALATGIRYRNTNIVICSDSRSAVGCVCDPFSRHPVIPEIHRWIRMLQSRGNSTRLCWVPSHCGVEGNEGADTAAREIITTAQHASPLALPYRDYYHHFGQMLKQRWARSWTQTTQNKLRIIKDSVCPWPSASRKNRLEEVVIARLRIGHTKITHGHLMAGDPAPYCEECLVPLSVVHILEECPEYSQQRLRAFGSDGIRNTINIKDILSDDHSRIDAVLTFLRSCALLHSI